MSIGWLARLWCRIVGHDAMSRLVLVNHRDPVWDVVGPGWQTWCRRCWRELPA